MYWFSQQPYEEGTIIIPIWQPRKSYTSSVVELKFALRQCVLNFCAITLPLLFTVSNFIPNSPIKEVLFSLIPQLESSERLRNVLKCTHLISGGVRVGTRAVWFQAREPIPHIFLPVLDPSVLLVKQVLLGTQQKVLGPRAILWFHKWPDVEWANFPRSNYIGHSLPALCLTAFSCSNPHPVAASAR